MPRKNREKDYKTGRYNVNYREDQLKSAKNYFSPEVESAQ